MHFRPNAVLRFNIQVYAMTNNDILRRLRFIFGFSDSQMMALFASGGFNASRELISDWMKTDDKPDFKVLRDVQLAIFLNGLINKNRGKREGEQPEPEKISTTILFFAN